MKVKQAGISIFYLEMTLEWDYNKRICKFSMPEYVKQALCKTQHIMTQKKYYSSPFTPPIYEKMAKIDTSTPMTAEEKNYYNHYVEHSCIIQEQ